MNLIVSKADISFIFSLFTYLSFLGDNFLIDSISFCDMFLIPEQTPLKTDSNRLDSSLKFVRMANLFGLTRTLFFLGTPCGSRHWKTVNCLFRLSLFFRCFLRCGSLQQLFETRDFTVTFWEHFKGMLESLFRCFVQKCHILLLPLTLLQFNTCFESGSNRTMWLVFFFLEKIWLITNLGLERLDFLLQLVNLSMFLTLLVDFNLFSCKFEFVDVVEWTELRGNFPPKLSINFTSSWLLSAALKFGVFVAVLES